MSCTPRERLLANRTYYVRTDGNDNNDGLADASNRAFLTIQHAVNVVTANIDQGPFSVTIQVGDGTYTSTVNLSEHIGVLAVTLKGNTSSPSNTIISTTSSHAIAGRGLWHIQDLTLQTTTSGDCLAPTSGAIMSFSNIRFGAAGSHHIAVGEGGFLNATGNYSIVGGGSRHVVVRRTASMLVEGVTVTLTGTPNFTAPFAIAEFVSFLSYAGTTFSGSATGGRYQVHSNSVIWTNSGGANFFPGNSAGSTATGGQYL